jgi:hypothetical protein
MEEKRYFIWTDGDGHNYCVPINLKNRVSEYEKLYSHGHWEESEKLFGEIESLLIPFEGILTFTNPKTEDF